MRLQTCILRSLLYNFYVNTVQVVCRSVGVVKGIWIMKYYSEDHVWVEMRGDEATVGISLHAADELGEIEYLELPLEDEDIIVGDDIGLLESTDGEVNIYAPLSGTIVAVNEELESEPALLTDSPEDKGWICKISNIDNSELADMMDETFYRKYLRSLNK